MVLMIGWLSGGRPGTRTRMGYPTRPSNVRVYQFRQPPGCSRLILRGWYPRQDSNSQPPDPKSGALSFELRGRTLMVWNPDVTGRPGFIPAVT
jgi:hypothetical protein